MRREIICGDSLQILKSIKDGSVDMILTDPPYKITPHSQSGTMGGYWVNDREAVAGRLFAHIPDIPEYISEFYRVLKDGGHCYIMCNNRNLYRFLDVIHKQTKFKFVRNIIWDKKRVITGTYYMSRVEYVIFLRKGRGVPINIKRTPDIIQMCMHPAIKRKRADGRPINPTEKPVGLFSVLVANSSKRGELVLDPFCGTGTAAVAAHTLDRGYICIDIDTENTQCAKARVEAIEAPI